MNLDPAGAYVPEMAAWQLEPVPQVRSRKPSPIRAARIPVAIKV
jgi:hypothetical protein